MENLRGGIFNHFTTLVYYVYLKTRNFSINRNLIFNFTLSYIISNIRNRIRKHEKILLIIQSLSFFVTFTQHKFHTFHYTLQQSHLFFYSPCKMARIPLFQMASKCFSFKMRSREDVTFLLKCFFEGENNCPEIRHGRLKTESDLQGFTFIKKGFPAA